MIRQTTCAGSPSNQSDFRIEAILTWYPFQTTPIIGWSPFSIGLALVGRWGSLKGTHIQHPGL